MAQVASYLPPVERVYLSHVCARWRTNLLDEPTVWSDIDCDLLDVPLCVDLFSRSGSVALHVTATREYGPPEDELVQAIAQNMAHIEDLALTGFQAVLSEIWSRPAPLLCRLFVRGLWQSDPLPVLDVSAWSFQAVRSLEWYSVRVNMCVPQSIS